MTLMQLVKEHPNFREYEFVFNFKQYCNKIDINNAFVIFFEQRYQSIKQNIQKLK